MASTARKWRCRRILVAEGQRLRDSFPRDLRDHGERKVDACRYAAACECISSANNARVVGRRIKLRQQVSPGPVARGTFAPKQARGAQDERTGADGCYIFRLPPEALDFVDKGGVQCDFSRSYASGHAEEIAAIDF